jgi:PKD repeat protein
MFSKHILPKLLITLLVMSSFCSSAQHLYSRNCSIHSNQDIDNRVTLQAGLDFPDYPILKLPESYPKKLLPPRIDNSAYAFLRPVFSQQGSSCGQSAAIAYNFCYEINRLRNIASNIAENQYPSHFTWNFMNASLYYDVGVSYFHSFEILKTAGCPNEATFGSITMDDPYFWMTGYDKYYQAMHNRISAVHSIPVGTPDGLFLLKSWLINHIDGSIYGGVANFYTGIGIYYNLPPESPEAGKSIIINWNNEATHALTIVGYDDSIRYDLNNDGLFTNDLDINNDGAVDMKDWEIGGVKFVNSYGTNWGDLGFCYALYSTLAMKYGGGGIWNNAAHVIDADSAYSPQLTIKALVRHNKRGRIRIRAGVSADTIALYPDHILEFPIFNYQGGDFYMQGGPEDSDKDLEFGLDITPLLGYTRQGSPSKFFLLIDENDPDDKGEGIVKEFSVIRYDGIQKEYLCQDLPFVISNNSSTVLMVNVPDPFIPLSIIPDKLPAALPGTPYSQQLTSLSGTPPYKWDIKRTYNEIAGTTQYFPGGGQKLNISGSTSDETYCVLPFKFPYYGKIYDTIAVHCNGYLLLQTMTAPYPYLQDENLYLTQIPAIAGYMNRHQLVSTDDQGIWYDADSSKAVFTWKAGYSATDTTNHSNFKIILFPDGKIVFSYGDVSPPLDEQPVIGISNGDGINYQFSEENGNPSILSSEKIEFRPSPIPKNLYLSDAGLLSSDTVNSDLSGDFQVIVSDSKRLRAEKNYTLTNGPGISYEVMSGTDNIIEPGEEATIKLNIKNTTSSGLQDLQFKLLSFDPGIQILDSLTPFNQLAIGEELEIPEAFRFLVSANAKNDHLLTFTLSIAWANHTIERLIEFRVSNPTCVISGPLVNDHDNYMLDAGEETSVLMRLSNFGRKLPGNYTGTLTCDDPYISVSQPVSIAFSGNGNSNFLKAEWPVQVNSATPPGHISKFIFIAKSSIGDSIHEVFALPVGDPSILVIDLDGNHNSAPHITRSINNLGLATGNQQVINSNIFKYHSIFLCLGVRINNHPLTAAEGNLLVQYLSMGNNLYMEGGATFGVDVALPIHAKFRVEGKKQAWHDAADTLAGDSGTFASGISFVYQGETFMGTNLLPLSPAVPIFTDTESGYHFVIINDSITYRTIASTIEFGSTYSFNTGGRDDLMRKYLDFFKIKIESLAANFLSESTEPCLNTSVLFVSHCAGNPSHFHWIFEGGSPSESDDPETLASWDSPGSYDVTLTISDDVTSNTVIKRDQIRVIDCNSLGSLDSTLNCFIYPNPSSGISYLNLESPYPVLFKLMISDITGSTLFSEVHSVPAGRSTTPLELHNLTPGLYLVTLSSSKSRKVLKCIVL